jgi:phage gpG-like protein
MSFDIDFIGLDAFEAEMIKAPEIVKEEMLRGIDKLTLGGQALSMKNVGVDTGHLRRSITTKKATFAGGSAMGSWGTNVPYAKFHETGRSAGRMPPVGAMQAWATRHGANAFLIARAIGRRGTKGKWYMRDAADTIRPKVQAEFKAVAARIVARIGG